MPRYTFKLCDDGSGVEDDVGVTLPNADAAYRYACEVVHELMDCRELRTRHWRLDVYEERSEKVFEIPFANLDPTLSHLTVESRSPVGRSRGKPHLATDRGRHVIGDNF